MAEEGVTPRYEFTRAVVAMLRLAQFDLNAIDLFGRTPADAWRALRFVLYSLPIVMYMATWQADDLVKLTGFTPFNLSLLAVERMLIAMFGFMLVVHHLGRRLGYNQYFAQYVTAQFYICLPVTLVIFFLNGLWLLAGVSGNADWLLGALAYALQIILDWAVTCAALRLRAAPAFAITAMNVLFNILVQMAMVLAILLTLQPGQAAVALP